MIQPFPFPPRERAVARLPCTETVRKALQPWEERAQPRPRVGKLWLETRSQEKWVGQPGFSSAFGEWWQITAISNPVQRQQNSRAPQSLDQQCWWWLQKFSENLALSSPFPRWGRAPQETHGKELQDTHGAIGHASKQTCLFFFEESMVKLLGCQPHWLKKMKNKFLIFKPCLGSKQHSRVPGTASLCRQGNCSSSLHLTFGWDDPYPYPPANTTLSRLFFNTPVWQVFHFILILSWTKFISKEKKNKSKWLSERLLSFNKLKCFYLCQKKSLTGFTEKDLM